MLKRRIKRITIKNYRSIADLTVELPDLTVLVGENGSGKSNFVDALRFLSDAIVNLSFAIEKSGGIANIKYQSHGHYDDYEYFLIEVVIHINEDDYAYGIAISTTSSTDMIQQEYCRKNDKTLFDYHNGVWKTAPYHLPVGRLSNNLVLPLLTNYVEFENIYTFLKDIHIYAIHPNHLLSDFQRMNDNKILMENGENLASILYHVQKNLSYIHDDIIEYLSKIVGIESIHVKEIEPDYLLITLIHNNQNRFTLSQESDGTVRLLSLLTALYQPYRPSLTIIEEPELFVHSGVLAMVYDAIEESALHQQIIITTHSPDLITKFDAHAIRVVELTDNGTKIDMIDDNLLEAVNQKFVSTGDILSMEGRLRRKQYDQ
ncbi:MAG: AAA family ATPase [bacterium]|nr:AAA family ATPase [bacterium]